MTCESRSDLTASAQIAGHGFAGATAVIRDTHVAVADRVFGLLGTPGRPAHLMHNGISRSVYAAVGGGTRAASYAAGQIGGLVSERRLRERPYTPLADTVRGNLVVGAINGAWGDTLERWGNPLALPMSVRVDGRDVPTDADSLAAAFPEASDDIVVFAHGLCETELAWWLKAEQHHGNRRSSHGQRLAHEVGATPVYLRYNTGRHISHNGEELAGLLEDLVAHWPTTVTRITLVGHSLGGLVARSACAHAQAECLGWLEQLKRVVYLGSPHLGAPLEVAVSATGRALRRLPETRPIATALASRSVGIKDLRFGDVLATDWADVADVDGWREEPSLCAPLMADVEHYYIGVTLTQDSEHLIARLVGDALVTFPSASGNGPRRRLDMEIDRGRHLGGLHHFDLLNHPRVWSLLRDWLVTD